MTSDNEARDRALYKYPDSNTLRNKLYILDPDALEHAEAEFALLRIEQGVPTGNFDLKPHQDIHRHIFQDVYEWAGELRQVDFHKTDWFLPHGRIQMGMGDVHARLVKKEYLQGLSREEFAAEAGKIIGDVNHAHPFREGNGRTQLQYLKQLSERAGYAIDLTCIERESWINASIKSARGSDAELSRCILNAIRSRR